MKKYKFADNNEIETGIGMMQSGIVMIEKEKEDSKEEQYYYKVEDVEEEITKLEENNNILNKALIDICAHVRKYRDYHSDLMKFINSVNKEFQTFYEIKHFSVEELIEANNKILVEIQDKMK